MKKIKFMVVALILILWGCDNNGSKNEYTAILEGTAVKIPTLTGGQIIQTFFDSGDYIKTGHLMARIDSTELFLQKEQLRASLEELMIQKKIAQTHLNKSEEDLQYVKTNKSRIELLVKNNSMPQQNLDDINNKLSGIESAVITARQNQRSLVARENQLNAQFRLVDKKLNDTGIVSPAEGIVTTKYYETGEAIPPLNPIAEVMDIRKLEAKIYISEQMLSQVKTGQAASIIVDGSKEQFEGQLIWISPKAEFTPKTIMTPETRTSLVYAVKIVVANRDQILKDGMPVVIKLSEI